MAYNKANYYKRIIEIQNIVLELKYQNEDLYYKEIYWRYIYPKYHISYRTFHTYLGINAKAELKKMNEKQQQLKQLKLF